MTFLLIVTLSSMLVAAIMSVIAWRIAAQERRRSRARVAALAAEIQSPASSAIGAASAQGSGLRRPEIGLRGEPSRLATVQPLRAVPQRWDDDLQLRPASPQPRSTDLFARPEPSASIGRFVFVAFGVGLLAALAAAAAIRLGSHSDRTPVATRAATSDNQTAVAQPAPLELVALGHERDGNRLTVRGLIRAPRTGAVYDDMAAVVFAFNADGGFVTSARAALDGRALREAGESPFVVTVPDAASASRYRVSFRSGDRIVAHVDRREPLKRP
jgi:hypothetical protein